MDIVNFRMQRNHNNGANPGACAACKHQRKKCGQECVLASIFPAEKGREFQAVHKVFGVSNVTKIVRNVKEEDRKLVAESLIWEAICRQKDPVLGPLGEYTKLVEELQLYKRQFHSQSPKENQMVQLQGQGVPMLYKSVPGLVGWNGDSNGFNNKKRVGFGGVVCNSMEDLSNFDYSSYLQNPEKVKPEIDVFVPQQLQQNCMNGFNQQFYIPEQFHQTLGKAMENTAWEERS